MGRLGLFVNRQTLGNAESLVHLIKMRDVAEGMGHSVEFIFPVDINKIPKLDALFIRARTDPMNTSFVASKIAEMNGVRVLDDPLSILRCSDKVNMYSHMMRAGVNIPETRFIGKGDLTRDAIESLFLEMGTPLVLKEPSTSFSVRVEKVHDADTFLRTAKRFIKLSDWVVVQQYVESTFDWRIGVLGGKLLYACKYIIPPETFKIQASVNGHIVYCTVTCVPRDMIPAEVVDTGLKAAAAIGNGLYGVDIKETIGDPCVIEVNDNPSIESGEDLYYPDMNERIIAYLMEGK